MQVTYDAHRDFLLSVSESARRTAERAHAELLGFLHAKLRTEPSYGLVGTELHPFYDRGYNDGKTMLAVEELTHAK